MKITPFKQDVNQDKGFLFKAAGQEVLVSSPNNSFVHACALGFITDCISISYKSIYSDIQEESSLPNHKTLFFIPTGQKPVIIGNKQCSSGIISYTRNSEYKRITPATSENISLQISDCIIEKYYQMDIDNYKNQLKTATGFIFLNPKRLKELYTKISLFITNQHAIAFNPQAVSDFNDYIFRFFVDTVLEDHKKSLRINNRHRTIKKAIETVNDSYSKNFTVTQLAEEVNVSTRALQVSFKQALGISPKKYLTNIRLTKIRQDLLTNKDRTISEICSSYGVIHFGNFSREYKRLFGEEPSRTTNRRP